MKTVLFLISFLLLSCGTDQGSGDTYIYTVRNESGVNVKVKSYLTLYPEVNSIITNISISEEIVKKYDDGLPPSGYSFLDFFGDNNKHRDSLVVIYDNRKVEYFIYKGCSNIRNPLNLCEYGGLEEVFIFTQQDYESAQDCNGNCD